MPKAILEFDLSDSHEHDLFLVASQAREYYLTLWELDLWLRNKMKNCEPLSREAAIGEVHDQLHGMLDDRNLSLEMLP